MKKYLRNTLKIYIYNFKKSHWFGSGTSKECSKNEHLNRG